VAAHLLLTSTRLFCKKYFDDKIATVCATTADADKPTFTAAQFGCELRVFTPVTQTEVTEMIRALPDKQCSSDPFPTQLLKTNANLLAPFLCRLFDWSLEYGVVLSRMKAAYITLIVKKADMDPTDTKSFGQSPIYLSCPSFLRDSSVSSL